MADYRELLDKALRKEDFYRFPKFTQDNVLELAQDLIESCKDFRGPLALEIDLAGVMVFRYYPTGTGGHNEMWLNRKRRTVSLLQKSSLRVSAELGVNGEDIEKDLYLNPMEYASCGGGFPIRLQSGNLVGFIGASGLTDVEDHNAIIGGLDRYFRRNFGELYEGAE
ncbi:MAG: heme-binding protein [Lachnospiraceae bacterium]|nr:heme-binding protein [Lachnospiraceae bacterium]